jgi:tRNA U34 5-carboxymethylaminomethyl modifying GTPase MnmE/TrmE
LELAMGKLGELDGRQVTIDIVDSIFHRFCVGK